MPRNSNSSMRKDWRKKIPCKIPERQKPVRS